MIWWIILAVHVPILFYILGGRKWLKSKPWTARFFAWIEPIEIALWRKSETVLWARFRMLMGVIGSGLIGLGTFDLSPLYVLLPEKWKWIIPLMPLVYSFSGAIGEWLRTTSTKPLTLVELPDKLPPSVAAAVNKAEATKETAVAVVEAAEQKAAA